MVMETKYSLNTQSKQDQDLKEWGVKARMISRDNTMSRRFSTSRISSFRDEASKSFRGTNFTVSSTASSPGYSLKDEIDPSTYSFTNALKALQLRSINTWEYLPDGFELNSKWNEAERYICNPLSGEVPMECLSSKTLMNGRSFRNITNRMTMSAPLIHHSSRIQPQKLANIHPIQDEHEAKENKIDGRLLLMMMLKRDVGIQSNLTESSMSPSPSPTSTPSIQERPIKFDLSLDSSTSSSKSESELKSKSKSKLEFKKEDVGKEEETKQDDYEDEIKRSGCMCKQKNGCLSLKNFWPRKRN